MDRQRLKLRLRPRAGEIKDRVSRSSDVPTTGSTERFSRFYFRVVQPIGGVVHSKRRQGRVSTVVQSFRFFPIRRRSSIRSGDGEIAIFG